MQSLLLDLLAALGKRTAMTQSKTTRTSQNPAYDPAGHVQ